jgi:hypothetical protein
MAPDIAAATALVSGGALGALAPVVLPSRA